MRTTLIAIIVVNLISIVVNIHTMSLEHKLIKLRECEAIHGIGHCVDFSEFTHLEEKSPN